MPDSNQNVTPIADFNSIGSWTKADYASLTADFISQMTTPQIKLMQHPEWVTGKAVSGFTAEHIPVLVVDFYNVTGEWLNNLNDEATKAITPAQMTRLTFYNLCNLDSHHLGQLTAAQVAGINDNYQWYSSTWLNSLTPEAFKGIPINKLNQIKLADFSLLHPDHIKAISSANLDALNDAHLKALTADQVAAIPALSSLSSDQFGLLNISGLSNAAIHNLSQTQRSGVTAQQVSTLSNEQVSELQSLNGMSVFSAAGFTKEQIPHISMNFFYFAPAWYDNLTTEAFQAITPAQIGQIYEAGLEGMGAKRRAELTKEQVAAITVNFYFLSSDWLNSLSTEAVKGITAKQLNQIQAGTFKGLDNAHLSALTVEQVAAASHLSSLSSNQFGLLDISGLSTSSIANLSQTEYAGLTTKQFSSLSTEQIQAMTHAQWLPDAVIGKLTVAQTVALGDHLAQFTAAQVVLMNHLQDLTSTQFGLLDISGLSVSSLASLTTTEYAGLTAKQIKAMSAEQINALQHVELLPVAAMSGFTAAQMPALSDNVLSHLSADQVAAMKQLSALSSVQFGLLNISKFSEAAINGLSKTEYEGITALQISTLTPLQIHAMWHTSWMPDATASTFTADQVKAINISMGYFTAGWLNNLSIEALQALTPAQTSQISSATLATLDNEHLHALTAEQIGGMNNFGGLSSAQFGLLDISKMQTSVISNFSDTEYKGLTANQIATLSAEQINSMGHAAWMRDDAASGFTPEQIRNCTQDFYWFSPGWLNSLSKEAFQAIKPENIRQMYRDALVGLDAERRSQLTAEQIAGEHYNFYFFSSVWFNSLSPEAMKGITAEHFTQIQESNFKKWDNEHLAALTATQVATIPYLNVLTSDQFGYLDISGLPVSAIEALSKTEYQGLTAKQIASLSAEQIKSLQHLGWISEAAAKGFTAAQMPAFGNDISAFPATFLNNLSIAAFAAFTPSQLASLSPVAFAGLEYNHFWALNDLSALSGLLSSLSTDQLLTVSQMMTVQQQTELSESQQLLINTSVQTGFSLVDKIDDPQLKVLMHNAVTNDASLFSFQNIESVLKDFASQLTGNLSGSQYNDIKNYVQAIGDVCGTDSAIYSLANGLIGTDGASINWTATGEGERIGSLNVGSSITQLNQLISTWFDGANDPQSSSSAHVDGRPLFANGGPSISDIHQGSVADCSLLSSLMTVVNVQPDFIKSMIVQNPNNTYSVRFFNNGVAHWVTVDGNTYSSGANSSDSSWVAIVERANVAFEATYLNDVNSYTSLRGGKAKLMEVTGDTLTILRAVSTSEETWNTTDFETLKTAVLNGAPAAISSWENSKNAATGQTNFVSGHAFAIIGFDEKTNDFIIANPWSADRTDGVQGTFEASMDQMWQHGNFSTGVWIANSNGASDAAGQLVHAMAVMNTSPSAALTTAALPVNVNNSPLAASHA